MDAHDLNRERGPLFHLGRIVATIRRILNEIERLHVRSELTQLINAIKTCLSDVQRYVGDTVRSVVLTESLV